MTESVIECRALRKAFGRHVAVADLTLEVARGEVFGFLGPNGAGKTTSVKLLLGLLEPSGGSGSVLGAPLGRREVRARIGFLPEHFRFHDCLTGRELLRVHGRLYGMRGRDLEARIDALLERMSLTEAAERRVGTYSKGMLQRIGLAQALLNGPELVFLDEPTSGLDPLGRRLVRNLIEDLRAAGTTVFLNSHLLGEVEAISDRVVFVKRGRVVHELSLADSAAGLDVELRLDCTAPAVLDGIASFGRDVRRIGDTVLLRVAEEARLPELARWLVGAGIGVYELRSRRKSLEDWFLEAMGEDQAPG